MKYLLFFLSLNLFGMDDSKVRNNVVLLTNVERDTACTGVSVQGASGKIYTMTSLHCKNKFNEIISIDEQNQEHTLTVISEDRKLDLLLLSPFTKTYLKLAKIIRRHEHIRSIGHGYGLPSYKEEGEMLQNARDSMAEVCRQADMYVSNVRVVPGNSGGPIVNDQDEIVGLARAFDSNFEIHFSCLVTLNNLLNFLSDK